MLRTAGFTSGVHLWLIKINNLSEPDSIFIGVCRGCMPLDQDPQVRPSFPQALTRMPRYRASTPSRCAGAAFADARCVNELSSARAPSHKALKP